jgi:hypothetical protein
MVAWLVGVVTVLYAGTAAAYWFKGDKPMSLVFIGYSLANVGLILADVKGA